jgi:hypothetical protein
MERMLVIRTIDSQEPGPELVKSGAVPSKLMLSTWLALDRIQAIASPLPDYQPGADPKNGTEYTIIRAEEDEGRSRLTL